MQGELSNDNIQTDSKTVADILGYLTKNDMLTRISRGHYILRGGSGLVTSDELRGEFGQTRLNEHD